MNFKGLEQGLVNHPLIKIVFVVAFSLKQRICVATTKNFMANLLSGPLWKSLSTAVENIS